jgi:hypothetical protein
MNVVVKHASRRLGWLGAAFAIAAALSGCSYHLAGHGGGAGNLPDTIKRIGVPTFQNLTPYPDLDRLFTEAVRIELQSHRKITVVPDASGVDALLTVSIQSLTGQVSGFTADTKQASRYTLTAVLSGNFKDVKADKELWSNTSVRLVDDYDVPNGVTTGDLASLFAQSPNALERIAKMFAQRLVSTILSGG